MMLAHYGVTVVFVSRVGFGICRGSQSCATHWGLVIRLVIRLVMGLVMGLVITGV